MVERHNLDMHAYPCISVLLVRHDSFVKAGTQAMPRSANSALLFFSTCLVRKGGG
jgi:hypothetical protein